MNFAQMLAAKVTPLSDHTPGFRRVTNPKPVQASESHHAKTIARYRAVMGDDWLATKDIENRLGVGRSCITDTLLAWLAKGIVERRKPCPDREWNRKRGYEWRFSKAP